MLCKKAILQMPAFFWRKADSIQVCFAVPDVSVMLLRLTKAIHVRFGDILVAFARGILSRDEVYDGVAAETNSSIEHVKSRSNNGIELPRERQRRRLSHPGLPSR